MRMEGNCCYILYSKLIDKFYIGSCHDSLEERIVNHNNHKYGSHRFTASANDWNLVLKIDTKNYAHAVRIERKIKSMKSRIYIQNLTKYDELIEKVILETT